MPDGKDGEYLPDRLADEAIAFVRQHRDGPFFLNWWPYSVHYPMQAREETIAKYRQRGGLKDPVYAAMIEDMDTAIGRFLKALDEAGLREKTLVIFKSDNGGYHGDNSPLRGFKGMLYEGGSAGALDRPLAGQGSARHDQLHARDQHGLLPDTSGSRRSASDAEPSARRQEPAATPHAILRL